MRFHYQRLRADANHPRALIEGLDGEGLWGAFTGLFGLGANEIITVHTLAGEPVRHEASIESETWEATVRPTTGIGCAKAGLYVFRRFFCKERDVTELVTLSAQAWETFEGAETYQAEPMGLFRPPADADGVVPMMLVTYYDGFASWETSRTPDAAATENFKRRRALTLGSYPIATRLVV